jgi:hypothetical protein
MFIPRLTGPKCFEGVVAGSDYKWPPACLPQLEYTAMDAVVFRVEEPIRGVGVGEFVARQSGGADCGFIFKLGVRYVYSLGVGGMAWIEPSLFSALLKSGRPPPNGEAWIVPPDMTAREAIGRWRLPTPGASWDPRVEF